MPQLNTDQQKTVDYLIKIFSRYGKTEYVIKPSMYALLDKWVAVEITTALGILNISIPDNGKCVYSLSQRLKTIRRIKIKDQCIYSVLADIGSEGVLELSDAIFENLGYSDICINYSH